MKIGYEHIRCIETGGPDPGVDSVGHGVITSINFLEKNGAYDDIDYVSYHVLGAVLCGNFAMAIRRAKKRDTRLIHFVPRENVV